MQEKNKKNVPEFTFALFSERQSFYKKTSFKVNLHNFFYKNIVHSNFL